jgi:hypothetical protein
LTGQNSVKPTTQVQQIAGAKRCSSSGDAPELVFLGNVCERYGNRLLTAVVIKVDDSLLTPMRRASDDVNFPTVCRQEGMRDASLCR